MGACVVDTSVIIKWFTSQREPGFERARQLLLAHRAGRLQLHVPLLAFYETGNALLRYGGDLPIPTQLRCLTDLYAVGLSVHTITLRQALAAHEAAHAFALSFYDACFIALAQELDLPFVTADERLCRQVVALPFVEPLASFRLS